jgi:hypothetical protein
MSGLHLVRLEGEIISSKAEHSMKPIVQYPIGGWKEVVGSGGKWGAAAVAY